VAGFHLGIDWGMDAYSVGNGQYRYAADLLNALARLGVADRVTVFGTRASPPGSVAGLFAAGTGWEWVRKPPATGRGCDWVNLWRSFRAHRRSRPDVLHVIDATVPALAPCPVVVTAYDLMVEVFPDDYPAWRASRGYRRWRWLNRHRVGRFAAISRTTAADYQRLWGIPPDRIDVVYLGVSGFPPAGFDQSWEETLAIRFPDLAGARFVLAPYNLEPRKNLLALLTAFRAAREPFPGVRLVLFGKGAWTAEREAAADGRIAELGIGPAVVRTGFVEDAALASLYRAADVFAFPALYEGFGLPVLEAMACGGCVLARDASAMAEVVGDAGLLVETADPAALAAGLTRLLGDEAERVRLRAAARVRAADFTPERMARGTAAVYRRALR
jgi:glycosyltransferase involved in cell wall biosynthesis